MKPRMIHTSPVEIKEGMINDFGIAGSCLFFSDDSIYQMSRASIYVYEASFNCVPAWQLYDEEIVAEIAARFGVDEDTAEALLDATKNEWYLDVCDADLSWWLQGKRGECAVRMGYDGCEDDDEQGTVYIVPMRGRESELALVGVLAE